MTATNHSLTGAVIALSIANPAIALPAALASHFVLDSMPHFDFGKESGVTKKSRLFRWLLLADMTVALAVIVTSMFLAPHKWLLIGLAAGLAASPDLMWFPHYLAALKDRVKRSGPLERFHAWIQWGERPWGSVVEIVWFITALIVLHHLALHS